MSEKCLRCGKCCYNGAEKCQYLIDKPGKKAYCRIWKTHAGHHIGKKTKGVCLPRILDDRIIEGCPYNEDIIKRQKEYKEALINGRVNGNAGFSTQRKLYTPPKTL